MSTAQAAHRILLVDDEPGVVGLISELLRSAGYAVTCAGDGQQALQQVKEGSPDLVILDLMLPKLNGYEVCTMLKQDLRYHKIPIILCSALSQQKDQELGRTCGADAYVRKPFDAGHLVNQVRALLQTPEASTEASRPASEERRP